MLNNKNYVNVTKLTLSIFMVAILSSCPSDEGCGTGNNNTYRFQVDVNISPVEEVYQIGDTLNVAISFPEAVFDQTTRESYLLPRDYLYLSNATVRYADNIPMGGVSFRMDSIVSVLNFASHVIRYNSYLNSSSTGDSNLFSEFKFDEVQLVYSIEYKLVLNEPGVFVLENRANLGDTDVFGPLGIDNICASADVKSVVSLNEEAQENFYLLEGTTVPLYINVLIDREATRFDDVGSFVFKVE
jgi:hypothetical protein